jgi:hypothetical protein
MCAHSLRRYKIKRTFFEMGFRSFASFFTVCASLHPNLSKIELATFWTNGKNSEALFTVLEEIIETLKNE